MQKAFAKNGKLGFTYVSKPLKRVEQKQKKSPNG